MSYFTYYVVSNFSTPGRRYPNFSDLAPCLKTSFSLPMHAFKSNIDFDGNNDFTFDVIKRISNIPQIR